MIYATNCSIELANHQSSSLQNGPYFYKTRGRQTLRPSRDIAACRHPIKSFVARSDGRWRVARRWPLPPNHCTYTVMWKHDVINKTGRRWRIVGCAAQW